MKEKCCFPDCNKPLTKYDSHNAQPCHEGRCCAQCNRRVVQTRLRLSTQRSMDLVSNLCDE